MENVIFREEFNPYMKIKGFIALFPDDEANPGKVAVQPFYFSDHGQPIFEPYCEADISYVLKCKIVHKKDSRIPMLKKTIEEYHNIAVAVKEKMAR